MILLTVLGVYLTALPGEFVWDDRSLIRGVRELQATGSVWKAFLRPFWPSDELAVGVPAYYRPLSILSFALDCRIHGDNSAGFRLTNLAFHILNTALVFALANEFRLKKRKFSDTCITLGTTAAPRGKRSVDFRAYGRACSNLRAGSRMGMETHRDSTSLR